MDTRFAKSVSHIQKSVIEQEDIANIHNTSFRSDFWSQIQKDYRIQKIAKSMGENVKLPIDPELYKKLQKT